MAECTAKYISEQELKEIQKVLGFLNSEFFKGDPLTFSVRAVDVNGEVVCEIEYTDNQYVFLLDSE